VTPVERFRDRRALVVWFGALLWDAAVALLWVIVRAEGGGWKGWLAFAVFGLAGLGLSVFALRAPVLRIDVGSSSMTVFRRYPLARRRETLPVAEVRGATLVEESDGDGSYYLCRIALRQGASIDLAAKGRRDAVVAVGARYTPARGTTGGFSRRDQLPSALGGRG
jgi:hypothetical protein